MAMIISRSHYLLGTDAHGMNTCYIHYYNRFYDEYCYEIYSYDKNYNGSYAVEYGDDPIKIRYIANRILTKKMSVIDSLPYDPCEIDKDTMELLNRLEDNKTIVFFVVIDPNIVEGSFTCRILVISTSPEDDARFFDHTPTMIIFKISKNGCDALRRALLELQYWLNIPRSISPGSEISIPCLELTCHLSWLKSEYEILNSPSPIMFFFKEYSEVIKKEYEDKVKAIKSI